MNKIVNYLETIATKQREAMADNEFMNPLTGYVGYGFDLSTGASHLPVAFLTFQNPNLTYNHHRLPVQAKFTPYIPSGSSGPPPASEVSATATAFSGVGQYREHLQSTQTSATASMQSFVGLNSVPSGETLQGLWNEYFSHDLSLGYSQQLFPAYRMELDATPQLDEHVMLALDSLPPSYASDTEKAAYKKFIQLWGTHYSTAVVSGGALEAVAKWNYADYRHSGMSLSSIASNVAADREILTGLSSTGAPLSANPSLNALYKAGRQLDPLHCYGGNPEDCSVRGCCLLFAVCCLLFVVCCLLFAVCCCCCCCCCVFCVCVSFTCFPLVWCWVDILFSAA